MGQGQVLSRLAAQGWVSSIDYRSHRITAGHDTFWIKTAIAWARANVDAWRYSAISLRWLVVRAGANRAGFGLHRQRPAHQAELPEGSDTSVRRGGGDLRSATTEDAHPERACSSIFWSG